MDKVSAAKSLRASLCLSACLAIFAGCGGSQPPIDTRGVVPQTSAIARHTARGNSWMLPEAKSEGLLYTSSGRTMVYVFSYPQGKWVGTLSGFDGANGECIDKAGDVFITNSGTSQVFEYAHGGTAPTNTLNDEAYQPISCSVDPISGNLAVANFSGSSVSIYNKAVGDPTVYSTPGLVIEFCGYDDKGNLFVDGYVSRQFSLRELTAGSGTFQSINVDQSVYSPGPIQWDGNYLALGYGQQNRALIYQLSISGTAAHVVTTTQLEGPGKFAIGDGAQWWIRDEKIVAPYFQRGPKSDHIGFWKYPGGGEPVKRINYKEAQDKQLWGITISP